MWWLSFQIYIPLQKRTTLHVTTERGTSVVLSERSLFYTVIFNATKSTMIFGTFLTCTTIYCKTIKSPSLKKKLSSNFSMKVVGYINILYYKVGPFQYNKCKSEQQIFLEWKKIETEPKTNTEWKTKNITCNFFHSYAMSYIGASPSSHDEEINNKRSSVWHEN